KVKGISLELECADRLSKSLSRLAKGGIDVILLDLSLPDSQGLETFIEVYSKAPQVPIIVLSGLDDESLAVKAVGKGAQDYLVKGRVDSNLLVRSIRYAIERKQVEEALEKSERLYKELWDNAPVAYHTIDAKGIITAVNKTEARMLGYTPEEMVGKSIFEFILPEQRAEAQKRFTLKIAGQKVPKAEDRIYVKKDGSKIYVSIDDVLEYDSEGKVIGVRTTMIDVTEQKLLQEQLIQSEKLAAIGELISGVAHEMNNPLTGIIGFAQLLKEEASGLDKDKREQIEMIYLEAMRMKRIVSNLLSFARKSKPEKKTVSINKIVETVLDMRDYDLKVNNIKVNKELGKGLPQVEIDVQQIEQVFVNIINNAEQAMVEAHGRGILTIRTYTKNNTVKIEFIDDGPGIPKKNLKKIFDPFFTTKGVGKGTGLGLSVSYGMMKAHNGNIFAESEEGKGAKFTVELPIAKRKD
ncbi:MAG TPA: hybrid sensor histidine kinase/response regulator, partial [Candidatus Omnitrophica bacterium]|nr:hybrid sensor histidine kinase/response regulator [Candidatus Omnitrophota bacterium]